MASAFGGTMPLIVTALISATGDELIPGYCMALAAIIALVPLIRMTETKGRSLRTHHHDADTPTATPTATAPWAKP